MGMRKMRKMRAIGIMTMTSMTEAMTEGMMVMTGVEGKGAMKPDNGTTLTCFLTSERGRVEGVVRRGEDNAVNAMAINVTTKRRFCFLSRRWLG